MTITSKRLPRVACVSFYGVGGVADIWQNGACQNYLLICEVLARLPSIKRVYLVDFGSSQLTTADLALFRNVVRLLPFGRQREKLNKSSWMSR